MADEVVSGLIRSKDIKVVVATTGELSRRARELHAAQHAAASMLAQGLTSAILLGSLQKEKKSQVNVQVECDGPLRGLFADADNEGAVRGYVKSPIVEYTGSQGSFEWRPVLGNSGFISVLRDTGSGEYHRSSVELTRFDLARDLEHYFEISDQLPTAVLLGVQPEGKEQLGHVGGALLQTLPEGDRGALEAIGERLHGGHFREALRSAGGNARSLMKALFDEEIDVLQSVPAAFKCRCSRDRVLGALRTMGKAELSDVLEKEKQADVTCHFCSTRYVITEQEIREIHGQV